MNPMGIMKIRGMMEKFSGRHPRIPMFLQRAANDIDEGAVIEMSVTTSKGETFCTNMKVQKEDIELVQELQKLK